MAAISDSLYFPRNQSILARANTQVEQTDAPLNAIQRPPAFLRFKGASDYVFGVFARAKFAAIFFCFYKKKMAAIYDSFESTRN